MKNLDQSPLVIAGPSGVGKTYIAHELFRRYDQFGWLLSTTDRPRRDSDVPGQDYNVIDVAEYDALQQAGDFFMDNSIFGRRYGFKRSDIERIFTAEKIPLALVYTPVVSQFIARYPQSHALFLEPDSETGEELLARRMKARGDSEASIAGRISGRALELAAYRRDKALYADVVIVRDNTAVEEVIRRIEARYQLRTALK